MILKFTTPNVPIEKSNTTAVVYWEVHIRVTDQEVQDIHIDIPKVVMKDKTYYYPRHNSAICFLSDIVRPTSVATSVSTAFVTFD